MLAPSHGALAPPPTGNSGSAPDLSKKAACFLSSLVILRIQYHKIIVLCIGFI